MDIDTFFLKDVSFLFLRGTWLLSIHTIYIINNMNSSEKNTNYQNKFSSNCFSGNGSRCERYAGTKTLKNCI